MVVVGLTLVEPLAEAEVKAPGVMATLVDPVVTQVSVELEPEVMLAGLAEKELMVGALDVAAVTVTDAAAVTDPAELVAVSV